MNLACIIFCLKTFSYFACVTSEWTTQIREPYNKTIGWWLTTGKRATYDIRMAKLKIDCVLTIVKSDDGHRVRALEVELVHKPINISSMN